MGISISEKNPYNGDLILFPTALIWCQQFFKSCASLKSDFVGEKSGQKVQNDYIHNKPQEFQFRSQVSFLCYRS